MSADLLYNGLQAVIDALLVALALRGGPPRAAVTAAVGTGLACLTALIVTMGLAPTDTFLLLRLLCFALFVHVPLLLLGVSIRLGRWAPLAWSLACAAAVVAVDAFLVEPHWLEVSRVVVESDAIEQPLVVAVLADIQTDRVGQWERRAVRAAVAARPDLVLLAGDYVQSDDDDARTRERAALRDLFVEEGLAAPLGVHAVEGNVDHAGAWWSVVDGVPGAEAYRVSHSVRRGPVTVTGLSFDDGFDTDLRVDRASGLHVVLAHGPDFALGDIDADLFVAGHTHGGQVRLPWFGPPITLSRVPRAWAAGTTRLPSGGVLVVSRGVGMERASAPRLRFLCRPEVVIIEVRPRRDATPPPS